MLRLRYAVGNLLGTSPVTKAFRAVTGQPMSYIKVLAYHDVPYACIAQFQAHIRFLWSRYKFIDPRQPTNGGTSGGIQILLTFDDGFKSNKVAAEEVLNPLGVKAVFFVPTAAVGMDDPEEERRFVARQIFPRSRADAIPKGLRFMDRRDLLDLLRAGHVARQHGQLQPARLRAKLGGKRGCAPKH